MIHIITFLFNPIDNNCCKTNCRTCGSFVIRDNDLLVTKKTVVDNYLSNITI